jgi:hypothetical protein
VRARRLVISVVAILVLISSVTLAQRRRGFFGRYSVKLAAPADFDGASFLFCRVIFRNAPYGDGGDWSVDYPRADVNLTFRLSELTTTSVSRGGEDGFNHVVVRLTDPLLYRCPFVMMTEVGAAYFDEGEAKQLRDYVLKGGFVWADDFWGEYAWSVWANEIGKALPPSRYPIVDLPLEHELFHTLYDVREVPQIPSIGAWGGPGGNTSERFDSRVPHVRVITDERKRILVLITHNTDFGDAFEREGDNREYFLEFAARGYAFGINAIVYGLSH